MRKIILLPVIVLATLSLFAQKPPYGESLERKRTLYKELPVSSGDIIFLGNSITEGAQWAELFDNKHVKNRGISGDRVEWLFDRVDYLIDAHPKKLFLMIGINDINGGRTAEAVVRDITRLIDMWRSGAPGTTIYVQSILPQNEDMRPKAAEYVDVVLKANEEIKKLCQERGIMYIDLHPILADGEGKLAAPYTLDGLHLTGEGYLRWADHIREYVK